MNFKDWISQEYVDGNNSVGRLARKIKNDKMFTRSNKQEEIISYLFFTYNYEEMMIMIPDILTLWGIYEERN